MAKVSLIKLNGEKVKDYSLNDSIWNIEVNEVVLKDAIKLALDSLRQGTHKTKTRAEVRGGGKKPWKQKGTGRARQGSRRAPNWVGGGVVFGVTPRNYTTKMNKKERVLALKSALTEKYQSKSLVIIDKLEIKDLKTKDLIKTLDKLDLNKKVLFVTKEENENLYMASRNLNNVGHIMVDEINVLDLVHADTVVFDEEAVKTLEEVLK